MILKKTLLSLLTTVTLASCDSCQDTLIDAECRYKQENVQEVCNNLDDNCDGRTDNLLPTPRFCGLNNRGIELILCDAGSETILTPCVDPDTCVINKQQSFYTGPLATKNIGACKEGLEQCTTTETGAAWSAIINQILPTTEQCNQQDDDCDGITDNKDRTPPEPCYPGPQGTQNIGSCKNGWRACGEAQCRGAILPQPEQCNTRDDDCDGTIDEGFPLGMRTCGINERGTQYVWCDPEGIIHIESCVDPDTCHLGDTTSAYTEDPTTLNIGECRAQITECKDNAEGYAVWTVTHPMILPQEEQCESNKDYNCNGKYPKRRVPTANILFFADCSVSFIGPEHSTMHTSVRAFADKVILGPNTDYRLGYVAVCEQYNPNNLQINYNTPTVFLQAFSTFLQKWGAEEPFYDTMYDAADPANPYHLTPLTDAPEYFIFFSDDRGQSFRGITQEAVADAIREKAITVYGFFPTDRWYTLPAYEKIINAGNGKYYHYPEKPNAADVIQTLEDLFLKCEEE